MLKLLVTDFAPSGQIRVGIDETLERRNGPKIAANGIDCLRLEGALYAPAPPQTEGTIGRPQVKGNHLPTLEQVAADPKTVWQRVVVTR